MKRKAKRNVVTKSNTQKVARLYHFEPQIVEQIELLGTLFGGKEKGIAAAVSMVAKVMQGQQSELQISIK